MNEYKINITEVLKKQIIVEAENPNKALDMIQKKYMKSNMKEFKDKNLYELDAKIVEENGEMIEENYEDERDEKSYPDFEKIDERLFRIERILARMIRLENYIDEKMDFIKNFAENAVELLEDIDENLDIGLDFLTDNVSENIDEEIKKV
jgi:hypothetical protein